jgi:hypothetical protein
VKASAFLQTTPILAKKAINSSLSSPQKYNYIYKRFRTAVLGVPFFSFSIIKTDSNALKTVSLKPSSDKYDDDYDDTEKQKKTLLTPLTTKKTQKHAAKKRWWLC